MLVRSNVGDTGPTRCLKAHESVAQKLLWLQAETVNPPETVTMRKTSNYIVSCLMNQSFDNEALHRKAKLTKSGSFPAATSSRMRRQGPTKLDHKHREIWPPSQSMEMEDDEEFYYVKHVLDLSGLIMKDQVRYSLEQPLNPDLFEEIETHYCDLDLLKSSIKVDDSKQDRRLIFDLINEALVYVNERPYLYYPKALSFICRLRPVPKEQHLLEEVRAFVGRSLNWIPNLDTLLESAVHESNWNGGWMNLQIESEIAALEVEDLILDELLDEILLC